MRNEAELAPVSSGNSNIDHDPLGLQVGLEGMAGPADENGTNQDNLKRVPPTTDGPASPRPEHSPSHDHHEEEAGSQELQGSPSTTLTPNSKKERRGLFRTLSKILKRRKGSKSPKKSPRRQARHASHSKLIINDPLDTEFDENDPFAQLQRQKASGGSTSSMMRLQQGSFSSIPGDMTRMQHGSFSSIPGDISDLHHHNSSHSSHNKPNQSQLEALSMSFSVGDTVVPRSSLSSQPLGPLEQHLQNHKQNQKQNKKQRGLAKPKDDNDEDEVDEQQEQEKEKEDEHLQHALESSVVDSLGIEDEWDSPQMRSNSNTPQSVKKTPPTTTSSGGLQTLVPPFGKSPPPQSSTSAMGLNHEHKHRGSIEGGGGAALAAASASSFLMREASTTSVGNTSTGARVTAVVGKSHSRQSSTSSLGNVSYSSSRGGGGGVGGEGGGLPMPPFKKSPSRESSTASIENTSCSRDEEVGGEGGHPIKKLPPSRESSTASIGNMSYRSSRGGGGEGGPMPPVKKLPPSRESSTASIGNMSYSSSRGGGGEGVGGEGGPPMPAVKKLPPSRESSTASIGNMSSVSTSRGGGGAPPLRQTSTTSVGNISIGKNSNTTDRATPIRQASGSSTGSSNHHRDLHSRSSLNHQMVQPAPRNTHSNHNSPRRSPLPMPSSQLYNNGENVNYISPPFHHHSGAPGSSNGGDFIDSMPEDVQEGLQGLSLEVAGLSPRAAQYDDHMMRCDPRDQLQEDPHHPRERGGGGGPPLHPHYSSPAVIGGGSNSNRGRSYSSSGDNRHSYRDNNHHRQPSYNNNRQSLDALLSPRAPSSSNINNNDYDEYRYQNSNQDHHHHHRASSNYEYNNHSHDAHQPRRDMPLPRRREYEREVLDRGSMSRTRPEGPPPRHRSAPVVRSARGSNYNNISKSNDNEGNHSNGAGRQEASPSSRDAYRDDGLADLKSQLGGLRPYRGGGGGGERRGSSGPAEIEIAPGVYMPLRGSDETIKAIEIGAITRTNCFSCTLDLHCLDDAEYVLCPMCRVVGPVESKSGSTEGHAHGVGLGVMPDQMRRWTSEMQR